ncbi:MAG: ATP-dependent DNA helicase RecQ, partial [Treponema sp.]|nr:ATP-dependent DNA helicase RecQ [Treponema sp.]
MRGKVFEAEATEADDPVLDVAKNVFGVSHLYPWQRLVIGNILDAAADSSGLASVPQDSTDIFCMGRQIVLLPTGAGKSMCFLLPAVMLPGPTLIFYPLLALMADQKRRLEQNGIECAVFRGGQSEAEREENFSLLKKGGKVILANPEVLQNKSLLERLKAFNISHIAIDEAHCVAEWGDSFRPAYLTLGKIIEELGVPLVTAFTATASPTVLERVSQVLFGGRVHVVRGQSDRPNIHYSVLMAWAKKKAVCRLAAVEQKPMLVFCGTRAKSEDMARELSECLGADKVRFYHAGVSREEKTAVEKWFFPKKDAILCCTCAFGMGVDKADIRTVVHLEASPTAESYIQEAGRGGRDKKLSKAILLWSREDSEAFEKFPKKSREYVLKKFAEAKSCRRQVLLSALGGEEAICSDCDICDAKKKAG